MLVGVPTSQASRGAGKCTRTVVADVVALDQPVSFWNRLGAVAARRMVYALKGMSLPDRRRQVAETGGVMHRGRSEKRPRPLVLRMNVTAIASIDFTTCWPGRRSTARP